MDKGLGLGITQHLCRFILSHRHRFDAAAIDLREIGGVVDGKGDDHGDQLVAGHRQVTEVVGAVGHGQQLQHQRRAAENGDEETGDAGDDPVFAHAQQRNDHAQRQGEQQRQKEDGAGLGKSLPHLDDHGQ